ncbi:MAG: hypothetical protein ABW220_07330, partial [Burkholderiaceae bacterium]
GVECGTWPLRDAGISSAPQLTYARELLALQRRFGDRRIQRLRAGRRALPQSDLASDDDGLCIVLQGAIDICIETEGRSLTVQVDAGEWIALPRSGRRSVHPRKDRPCELLRLHGRLD